MTNKRNGIVSTGLWVVDNIKMIEQYPEEGQLVKIQSENLAGGGAPFNVLMNLAVMDSSIPLFAAGLIGDDEYGKFIKNKLHRHINQDGLLTTTDFPTSHTDVMTNRQNGNRTFFHYPGTNAVLDIEHIIDFECDAKIFHLGYLMVLDKLDAPDSDYGTRAARLLCMMQEKGYKTSIDVVTEKSENFCKVVIPALKYTDYLIVNELEAEYCTGIKIRNSSHAIDKHALATAAEALISHGVSELVAIHFPEGAYLLTTDDRKEYMPSYHIKTTDIAGTVGAGDAFCAGILYGINQEMPYGQCLQLAHAAALHNLKCENSTDGAVGLEVLMAYIRNNK